MEQIETNKGPLHTNIHIDHTKYGILDINNNHDIVAGRADRDGPKPGCQEAFLILEAEVLTFFKLEAEVWL